ncbi:MAG: hypothetical protein IJG19_06525 [Methanobrevibacter sp.]|nr:hypothetical protein [Methanobrevibacter sp.]
MSNPVRLHKQPTREDYQRDFNLWVVRNFGIVALATIIVLLIIFITVCWMICGVAATDSGVVYNHFDQVI